MAWWRRPVPMVIGGMGVALIGLGLMGPGSGGDGTASDHETVDIPLAHSASTTDSRDVPGARLKDVLPEANPTPADRPEAGAGHGAAKVSTPVDDQLQIPELNGSAPEAEQSPAAPVDVAASEVDGIQPDLDEATDTAPADTPDPVAEEPHEGPDWETIEVQSGDSLAALFSRAGLSAGELHRVVNTDERTSELQRIYPGDELHFHVEDDVLQALRYKIDDTDTLVVERKDDDFDVSIESQAVETRVEHAVGTVESSLFAAGAEAGMSHNQIMRLMHIFEWQVDFGRDVRSGDTFSIAYEAHYLDGEHIRDGNILAARYVNRGDEINAVRYTDPDGESGYYSPDGDNLRKALVRRPIPNARVSSQFDRNRKHPVLGIRRPHLGTDFAASRGTPVPAAGAGRVVHASRKGGYGHTVIIEHAGRYRTVYAHLSSYADGISPGTRVEQGQTIGRVGSTGLATGPHLHYEVKVDGEHRDPLQVDLPSGDPVATEHMDDFQARAAPLLAQLQDVTDTELALQED